MEQAGKVGSRMEGVPIGGAVVGSSRFELAVVVEVEEEDTSSQERIRGSFDTREEALGTGEVHEVATRCCSGVAVAYRKQSSAAEHRSRVVADSACSAAVIGQDILRVGVHSMESTDEEACASGLVDSRVGHKDKEEVDIDGAVGSVEERSLMANSWVPCVTAGILLCSWTVDSGYMPFSGRMCRS